MANMPYEHLLVPIDWADPDQRALDAAIEMATQHRARTTLIYVIEAIDAEDEDELQSFYAEVEDTVRERLQTLIGRFQQAGLVARPEIVIGHKARTIVQYTATASVDLIVMQSERFDLQHPELGLNSLSHQVSLFSQCPVMLIK
jgi:nucleotide-binding universal stress UspA family protein